MRCTKRWVMGRPLRRAGGGAVGLAALLAVGCAPSDEPAERPALAAQSSAVRAVPGADHLRRVAQPGPPPHEAWPPEVLWIREADQWRPGPLVLDVSLEGRAILSPDGRLTVGEQVVAEGVYPPLASDGQGALAFAAGDPPESDVYVLRAGDLKAERVTDDGQSDRPLWLPDGRLLWVSAATGWAGFVIDGRRLTNGPEVPREQRSAVPARADWTHWQPQTQRVRFFDGEGFVLLDPQTGRVETAQPAAPKEAP